MIKIDIFRAKRIDNGKFVSGYAYAECGNHYIMENRQKEFMGNRNTMHKVDSETYEILKELTDEHSRD